MQPIPYISDGNRKMTLPTFSLPAVRTCTDCTIMCVDNCYARKAERAYPQILPCRMRNWQISQGDTFVDSMVAIIRKRKSRFFRIHESGDFYDQTYLNKWIQIALELPEVSFLAFTKSFHLDFAGAPANLKVVWSIWPDTDMASVPAGNRAYAGAFVKRQRTLECPGNCDQCGMCWHLPSNLDVHFDIH